MILMEWTVFHNAVIPVLTVLTHCCEMLSCFKTIDRLPNDPSPKSEPTPR